MRTSASSVELVEAFSKDRVNRRVIVGEPEHEGAWTSGADGVRRRLLRFAPGARFAVDYWERNEYGTQRWRVAVCEALTAAEGGSVMPSIRPAVAVLADIQGAARVRAFLAWMRQHGDRIEDYSHAELARIELHFQRMPLARLGTQNRKNRP